MIASSGNPLWTHFSTSTIEPCLTLQGACNIHDKRYCTSEMHHISPVLHLTLLSSCPSPTGVDSPLHDLCLKDAFSNVRKREGHHFGRDSYNSMRDKAVTRAHTRNPGTVAALLEGYHYTIIVIQCGQINTTARVSNMTERAQPHISTSV